MTKPFDSEQDKIYRRVRDAARRERVRLKIARADQNVAKIYDPESHVVAQLEQAFSEIDSFRAKSPGYGYIYPGW